MLENPVYIGLLYFILKKPGQNAKCSFIKIKNVNIEV